MEQLSALSERIRSLKQVARSMADGTTHTELFPEIDKVVALPEDLSGTTVGEREAIARQIREYEQTFDSLGYSLLRQIMPNIGVSPVFQVVQAADQFKNTLRSGVGSTFIVDGKPLELTTQIYDALTQYSLSIGTPPVTTWTRELVAETLFGHRIEELATYVETLGVDPVDLNGLLNHFSQLIEGSLHYNTAAEESAFLRDAAEFVNFEGGRLFNRVVITESPARVVELIQQHLFDKFGPTGKPPVRLVSGCDGLDGRLLQQMRAEPNQVFVVRVTRIPHRLFQTSELESLWRSVIGRLILIDESPAAKRSNTTVVYTLFPHVARTLRNIQTGFAGRPANTQLELRRILERFSVDQLQTIRSAIDSRLNQLQDEKVCDLTVEQLRAADWRRDGLWDYLSLAKLRRLVAFVETIAKSDVKTRTRVATDLKQSVAPDWMRYFYKGLPAEEYTATVLSGGGRGALTMIAEFHRHRVSQQAKTFCREHLAASRQRLADLKRGLQIPSASTDEIEAALKQSQLRSLSPSQQHLAEHDGGLGEHLAKSTFYSLATTASNMTRRAREGLQRAAFGNLTGGAAALVKRAMADAGLGALHGHLEDLLGERVERADRRLRDKLTPIQHAVRSAQRSMDALKGELDPIAIGEIEALLNLVEQEHFYPSLILPVMSWSYGDVFSEKYYPSANTIRVPHDNRQELDPSKLLERLEELRYLLRLFPEVFDLLCRSMLLIVNSPHNPTGVVYRRETILKLLQIASDYHLTIVDDNSYHKLVTKQVKAREGDDCVAQIYQKYRNRFSNPVTILTAAATTKGFQGSGDRTGLLHSNQREAIAFAKERAHQPHLMSLYVTQVKLESGLAAKRYIGELEKISAHLLDPDFSPWQQLEALLARELPAAKDEHFPVVAFRTLVEGYETLLRLRGRGASRKDLSASLSELVSNLKLLRLERALRSDVQQRVDQIRLACLRALKDGPSDAQLGSSRRRLRRVKRPQNSDELNFIVPQGAFYACVQLCNADDDRNVVPFLLALCRHRKIDMVYAGSGFARLSLGGELHGTQESYDQLGQCVATYLRLLRRYWLAFDASGRDLEQLDRLFVGDAGDSLSNDGLPGAVALDQVSNGSATPTYGKNVDLKSRGRADRGQRT